MKSDAPSSIVRGEDAHKCVEACPHKTNYGIPIFPSQAASSRHGEEECRPMSKLGTVSAVGDDSYNLVFPLRMLLLRRRSEYLLGATLSSHCRMISSSPLEKGMRDCSGD